MAFGLSGEGFERKRLSDIKSEIEDALKTAFGPGINLTEQSVFGQLVGILAERESLLWELAEDVYNSQYPDTAEGAALDNVVAITGITRRSAQASRMVQQLLFGTAGTLVPTGTIFSVNGNASARFVTDADVTLVAGTDEVQTISFGAVPVSGSWKIAYLSDETSALPFNATNAQVQTALNALANRGGITVSGTMAGGFTVTFAGADGKQNHPSLVITSNTLSDGSNPVTATVATSTEGVPQGVVSMTAESTGPTQANAYTLTVIETPVTGLTSTRNPEDAILGRNTETDAELRERREETLQVAGAATVEAIRARLLGLTDVTDVIVFENETDVTDIDGRPPHSFEAVVNGGDAQEIVDKIFEVKPAGIQTVGNQTGTAIDSQGFSNTINWSRPTEVDIYLEMDISVTVDAPVNATALVEDALVAYGNGIGIGKDVIVYPRLVCALEQFDWITDVVTRIGTAPGPTLDDNIAIAPNEIPKFDTSRTTVTII